MKIISSKWFYWVAIIISLLSLPGEVSGQTISGIINTYTSVTAIPSCNPCALSCSTITVASTAGLTPGDQVLLIQMKGATADLSNTAAFGSIGNYGAAGNYEKLTIASVSGLNIVFTTSMQFNYDPTAALQLVKYPVFNNVTVNGLLTALPWNGSVGGVLIFECTGTLTLSANIDVSTLGFRGGASATNSPDYPPCSGADYFYGGAVYLNGAPKGEGIAMTATGYELGKGAWTNGGGGGNSHNGGGGGGSNAGAGGFGGNEYAGCGGTGVPRGIGGYALNNSSGAKIFMGGGGGGGQQNNNVGTAGGNGGGIIMIKAAQIIGNNFSILSNGADALATTGSGNDGAGGGGGGGSIQLTVPSYTGDLSVSANGGAGGNMIATAEEHAPGGGAGGGLLCFSVAAIPASVTRSVAGGTSGISLTSSTSNGASSGSAGIIQTSCNPPVAATPKISVSLGPDVTLCNPITVTLDAGNSSPWYNFQWLRNGTVISGATSQTLFVNSAGTYVVIVSSPGCVNGRDTVVINSQAATPNNATFCPAPQAVSLSVTGSGKYKWYTAPIGGTMINTGTSYTPTLSASTTYYVEDTTIFTGTNFTPKNMLTGFNQRGGGSNTYMAFDALTPITIDSVTVFVRTYNNTPATMTIELKQGASVITSKTINVTSNCNCTQDWSLRIGLGFNVPVGTNYHLDYTSGGVAVHWDGSGAAYPYTFAGIVKITGAVDNNGGALGWAPSSYGIFYDWKVSYRTLCSRVPVTATLSCPVPVTFLTLTAEKQGDHAIINWFTSSEINNDYFEVERSMDGIHFYVIQRVEGNGNSTGIHTYSIKDTAPPSGTCYYRIAQYDFDGNVEHSHMVSLINQRSTISVYPNPFSDLITIRIEPNLYDPVTARITDLSGKECYLVTSPNSYQPMELYPHLPAGSYFLHINHGNTFFVEKIIKVNVVPSY
jgi:hypothetical protein